MGFFAHRVIYFGNKLLNQIKKTAIALKKFKIKFGFRKNGKKKDFREHFWELSGELTKFDLYIDIILMVYMC